MLLMRANTSKRQLCVLTEQDELFLFRALLRAADMGVLLSDPNRTDLICNDTFCLIFGINGIETLRLGEDYLRQYLIPRIKDGERFLNTLEKAYADPHCSFEDEIEMILPRYRCIRRFTTPVVDEDGEIIGRLWTFLDITHIRKLEQRVAHQAEQLKEQARQLASDLRSVSGRLIRVESELTLTQRQLLESERMSAAGLLGASVAHNIRNILTPLRIELSLARAATTPEQQTESFTVIEGQLERLSLMTHRLLAIARPADSEPAAIDMGMLVTHATDLVAAQAATENVKIETKCSPRTPEILGDPVQLDQLIVNLALNGIQAMHAKGGGTLGLKVYPDKDGVCLQVTDTGDGIPPETRKRLFDPFFSTRPDGTGLGLYSCRRITQEHGGKISVRSTMGQGTRVTVWLPVGEVEHAGKNLGS